MKMCGLAGAVALLTLCATEVRAQVIDHSHTDTGNDDMIANQCYEWGPIFLGGVCRLTDKGTSETASIFSRERVNVAQFTNTFEFQIISGGPDDTSDGMGNCADGMTFVIQNDGLDGLGAAGGNLGYGGAFAHSIAIKLDTVPNGWDDGRSDPSYSTTGLYTNGAAPAGGYDLLKDGVNLRSQHPFRVEMRYDGKTLAVRIADLKTNAFSVQKYTIDIPATIGNGTAFVGFTASTGLGTAAHDLHKWYWASPTPDGRLGVKLKRAASLLADGKTALANPASTVAAWPTVTHRAVRTARMPKDTSFRIARAR